MNTKPLAEALASGEPIGWQIVDADGNVVQSGPVSFASLVADGDDEPTQES